MANSSNAQIIATLEARKKKDGKLGPNDAKRLQELKAEEASTETRAAPPKEEAKKDPQKVIDTLQERVDSGEAGKKDKERLEKLKAEQGSSTPTTSTPTTSTPSTTETRQDTATPTETEAEARARREASLDADLAKGKDFGNTLIDDLGMRGEFLGRIDEGPSADYYADLARTRELAENAGNYTNLDNEALGYARSALDGISAPENEALRSAATRGVDQQFGQARQQLLRYQGGIGSQVQRASQIGDLAAKRVGAQRELSRDLLIANIQEKKDARAAFDNLTNTIGNRTDQRVQGLNSLVMSGQQFADSLKSSNQQFNNQTGAQEIASRTGAYLGGIGTVNSMLGGYKADDFQNTALQEALAAKDREIEATKKLAADALAQQERIAKLYANS